MPIYTKQKIPWYKVGFVILAIIFIIVLVGVLVPDVGMAMYLGLVGFGIAVYDFFAYAPYQVLVTALIVGGVLILITQRKYFFKEKKSDAITTTMPVLQSAPIQTQPFAPAPGAAQVVQPINPEKEEVTTS